MLSQSRVTTPTSDSKARVQIHLWNRYWGLLWESAQEGARLYGFNTEDLPDWSVPRAFEIPDLGNCFGFVSQGRVAIRSKEGTSKSKWNLESGQWFSLPGGVTGEIRAGSNLVIAQRLGFEGFSMMGGPVEEKGRLKYIDGCSDSLLSYPPRKGDPCTNLLYFPPGTAQTSHTHPSVRLGMVISGKGICESLGQTTALLPGNIFCIPTDVEHRFATQDEKLRVFAFHPDSDWGPEDENHPMINRTWVNGKKIEQ